MNRIPDREECLRLLSEYGTPYHVIRHCMAVCQVSVAIGNRLNEKGYHIDIDLLRAAAMLHDISRVHDKHETVGAIYLSEKGYKKVADIVIQHTSYHNFNKVENINETDLLCIGDRTVKEDQYVGVDERMQYIKEKALRMGRDAFVPGIEKGRLMLKEYIKEIEAVMGISLDDLMKGLQN